MGQSIAVMNTKGGVGKSTIVMALAETLSAFHGKNVLVIDSDSQTSISSMLMHLSRWEQMERQGKTLVDLLMTNVLGSGGASWRDYVASGVSDVEDSPSVYLIPSHMELSLLEREVSAEKREGELRAFVRTLLAETCKLFDIVLIDCPPGLSLLTECWLREVDYVIPPTKPDYLAVRGLAILKRFREQHAESGFGELLGVLINLKDGRIASEDKWHADLAADPANRVFKSVIPRRAYIQRAADFDSERRTYIAKYPGDAGQALRQLTVEVLERVSGADRKSRERSASETQAAAAPVVAPAPAAAVASPAPEAPTAPPMSAAKPAPSVAAAAPAPASVVKAPVQAGPGAPIPTTPAATPPTPAAPAKSPTTSLAPVPEPAARPAPVAPPVATPAAGAAAAAARAASAVAARVAEAPRPSTSTAAASSLPSARPIVAAFNVADRSDTPRPTAEAGAGILPQLRVPTRVRPAPTGASSDSGNVGEGAPAPIAAAPASAADKA